MNFSFKGTFYHNNSFPDVPNIKHWKQCSAYHHISIDSSISFRIATHIFLPDEGGETA